MTFYEKSSILSNLEGFGNQMSAPPRVPSNFSITFSLLLAQKTYAYIRYQKLREKFTVIVPSNRGQKLILGILSLKVCFLAEY